MLAYIGQATAIVTAVIAGLLGAINLLEAIVCFLQGTVLCSLTSAGSGAVSTIGSCFEAAGPCKAAFWQAILEIGVALGISSPGLQRMKVGAFKRDDQPVTQAKV